MLKKLQLSLIALFLSVTSITTTATVVEVQTVLGNFQVNLFDKGTPQTVDNFLGYVNSGAYFNNVVHRSVSGFIVQSGGFQYNNEFPIDEVVASAPVANEPHYSNVRGTIAMAKLSNSANSATSQWFVNLNNNSTNLDVQNGGFTVFGQVLGDGMQIVDAIAALNTYNLGGALNNIPLVNYSVDDANAGTEITGDNLMLITDIIVIDSSEETHPEIVPVENTLIDTPTGGNGGGGSSSSGGGSLPLFLITLLSATVYFRRLVK